MRSLLATRAADEFLGALSDGIFLSTQYVRHPSAPFYTPEPDLLHEFIGHGTTLLDARFAELHRAFGAAARVASSERMGQIERLYWFTVEYGMVREDGVPRALGAGLLSSCEELEQCGTVPELLPFDAEVAARTDYDPTRLQPRLFVADSFGSLVESTVDWLS